MDDKMGKTIQFTKMHGAGNDYIYVNVMDYPLENPSELAIRWSVPHFGIGADGLILIDKSDKADFKMRMFNSDGSEGKMCGNGARCIGKYVYDKGLTDKTTVSLETLAGIKELQLKVQDGVATEVTVDMGAPKIGNPALIVEASGQTFIGTEVSMGNPHLVIFVDDVNAIDLPVVGPLIEKNPLFPEGVNVEFVQVRNPEDVRMRVWERGSGITMACGTGACATVVAGAYNGKTKQNANVEMDGGTVNILWDKETGDVFKTGGAAIVFEGTISI
ncbi:diaminopimelate epimerase [Bacteroidia bacterium]|nr:diaminopimelate epimerase [Bacteroidia bacterium]